MREEMSLGARRCGKRTMALCVAVCLAAAWLVAGAQEERSPSEGEVGTAGREASSYEIGVSDVLTISVYGEDELGLTVPVRPDGRISLPLIDEVIVAGRTPEQADAEITERLAKVIREPEVTVIVSEVNSLQIYVLGQVQAQGALTLRRPTRLIEAIALAGGLTEYAKGDITLVRTDGLGRERRKEVEFDDYVRGDADAQNPPLRPGDLILVE